MATANEVNKILAESFLIDMVANKLDNLPHRRELLIQTEKLRRIISKRNTKALRGQYDALAGLVGVRSTKKDRKRHGEHMRQISRQHKLVRDLILKSSKELFRRENPMTNAEFSKWRRQWEEGLSTTADKMVKDMDQLQSQKLFFGEK